AGRTTRRHRRRLGHLGLHVRWRVFRRPPEGRGSGGGHPAGEGGQDHRHHALDDAAVRGPGLMAERPSPYPYYVRKYPRGWWLRRGPYLRFAAREITSMFAAIVSGFLIAF